MFFFSKTMFSENYKKMMIILYVIGPSSILFVSLTSLAVAPTFKIVWIVHIPLYKRKIKIGVFNFTQ